MNNILETVFKDLIEKGIVIVEQDDAEEVESEGKAGTRTVLKLPKFKINEKNWGKTLETDDRAIIERIGAQLKGDDPLDRVEYLQRFLNETESVKSDVKVGEVMGTLMFLDIFASVVFDFNASVAGFLFEALFAGIFEGFQIEAKEGGGEAGTTDVILNVRPKGKGPKSGVEYSFKLLSAANPEIKGSFKDLVDGISKSPDAQETYLVVLKSGDEGRMNLDFYEYDINQKNWFEWVGVPKVGTAPVLGKTKFNLQKGQYPQMPKGVKITAGRAEKGKFFNGEYTKRVTKPKDARDAYNKIEGSKDTKLEKATGDKLSGRSRKVTKLTKALGIRQKGEKTRVIRGVEKEWRGGRWQTKKSPTEMKHSPKKMYKKTTMKKKMPF